MQGGGVGRGSICRWQIPEGVDIIYCRLSLASSLQTLSRCFCVVGRPLVGTYFCSGKLRLLYKYRNVMYC